MVADNASREVIALAQGLSNLISTLFGSIISGFRHHTISWERYCKTENTDVIVIVEDKPYYGLCVNMFDLDYYSDLRVTMLKCDWVDINSFLCKAHFLFM